MTGWKMPPRHCKYVSGGSCAPGAKMPTYNRQGNFEERLCCLCIGPQELKCDRSSAEPYYSYAGAFRCPVHGGGDVAFVKLTTVPDHTGWSLWHRLLNDRQDRLSTAMWKLIVCASAVFTDVLRPWGRNVSHSIVLRGRN